MARDEIFREILKREDRYATREALLLPTLHLVQQHEGYISDEAIAEVATFLELPPIRVEKVLTFYTMYRRKPVGRYFIEVCKNISCSLLGADHLISFFEKRLGITVGETTADGLFTLGTAECLGSCGTAPVMMIGDTYYENLTEERIVEILDKLREEAES